MTVMDRALNSIIFLYDLLFKSLDNLNIQSSNILVISFESFVMNTEDELQKLQDFLGRSHSDKIKKILKQQKIPRSQLSQGKGHAGYGWSQSKASSEKEKYNNQLEFIHEKASEDALQDFDVLLEKYNEKWPSILNQYR